MPTTTTLLGFVAAALALLITPGPAVLYLVTRSLSQGTRAGLISVLGLSTGVFVHIGAAAAGISALVLASAAAFTLVKGLGAVYLIYLGLRTILTRGTASGSSHATRASHRLFLDGVVVSVFNPKLAIFFLAFLPQFVDPTQGPVPRQIVILGLIYIGLALITDSTYAVLASRLRRWGPIPGSERSWPKYLAGSVYLGLGVTAALTGRRA
jgi:threonine/homoserine/homoserine lactone efflux protein